MPRRERPMGKWKPSVDIRCLFSMMSPEDTAIQPTQDTPAATCRRMPSVLSMRSLRATHACPPCTAANQHHQHKSCRPKLRLRYVHVLRPHITRQGLGCSMYERSVLRLAHYPALRSHSHPCTDTMSRAAHLPHERAQAAGDEPAIACVLPHRRRPRRGLLRVLQRTPALARPV